MRNEASTSSSPRLGAFTAGLLLAAIPGLAGPASAAVRIEGQVQAGGGPVARSTVSLWAASADAPARLAQVETGADGGFVISTDQTPSVSTILYLVANGGEPSINKATGNNPAIAFMAVLDNHPPATVVINEMTTVASVWTTRSFSMVQRSRVLATMIEYGPHRVADR